MGHPENRFFGPLGDSTGGGMRARSLLDPGEGAQVLLTVIQ